MEGSEGAVERQYKEGSEGAVERKYEEGSGRGSGETDLPPELSGGQELAEPLSSRRQQAVHCIDLRRVVALQLRARESLRDCSCKPCGALPCVCQRAVNCIDPGCSDNYHCIPGGRY